MNASLFTTEFFLDQDAMIEIRPSERDRMEMIFKHIFLAGAHAQRLNYTLHAGKSLSFQEPEFNVSYPEEWKREELETHPT